jgi:3',5'-cyclic AMP phosphodiesterase CpdA
MVRSLGVPRVFIRQCLYLAVLLAGALLLILVANKKQFIALNDYLPANLTPAFFQPPANLFIIDVSINGCLKFKSDTHTCGLPANSGVGHWTRLDKDLTLGLLWTKRNYLSYKKVKEELLNGEIDKAKREETRVIVDLAVANRAVDEKIAGNRKAMVPLYVLNDLHGAKVFDDETHAKIVAEKGGVEAVTLEKDKLASAKMAENQSKLKGEAEGEARGLAGPGESKEGAKGLGEPKGESKEDVKQPESKIEAKQPGAKGSKSEPKEPEGEIKGMDQASKAGEPGAKDLKSPKDDPKASSKDQKPINGSKPKADDQKGAEAKDEGEKAGEPPGPESRKEARSIASSRHELLIEYELPTPQQLAERGWVDKGHGIWARYGASTDRRAITAIDVLFGADAVEPRPNWKLISHGPLVDVGSAPERPAFLSIRRGPRVDYKKYQPALKINKDGKFKILQVADLHFLTGVGKCRDPVPESSAEGCEADPRTLRFLSAVLDHENPDLVVLTGDQIFGQELPDLETALFKALNPFISRKIPYAVVMGNHDDEGSLTRAEVMGLALSLPYSVAQTGPPEIAGVGNYVVTVEGQSLRNLAVTLYFLDTHRYLPNPKVNPGYDWIKELQLKWLEDAAAYGRAKVAAYTKIPLSMAFFHIPLPEFRNTHAQPYIGEAREPPTAPRYNTGARLVLLKIGVNVVSVGHDHANDYCLMDEDKKIAKGESKFWLCYGGGAGEGGYGGYGGYVRRVRTFELDTASGEIKLWKRREDDPDKVFDEQILVSGGKVVNF